MLSVLTSTLQHQNEHLKLQKFWFCVDQSQGKSWQTSRSQHNKLISVAANGLVFLCLIGFFLETIMITFQIFFVVCMVFFSFTIKLYIYSGQHDRQSKSFYLLLIDQNWLNMVLLTPLFVKTYEIQVYVAVNFLSQVIFTFLLFQLH